MSSKGVPRCSLQTASSIRGDLRLPSTWTTSSSQDTKAASFAALPPSPAPHNSTPQRIRKPRASWWCCLRTPVLRWGCDHPQLCFLLLYVGCTCASGLYASTLLANCVMRAMRVPDAIGNAQQAYGSTSLQLRNASGCVVETSVSHMLEMKVAFETTRRRVNEVVQVNARALDRIEDDIEACSDHFLTVLNATASAQTSASDGISSSSSAPTLECFSDAFWSDSGSSTDQSDGSRAVFDRVRLVLLSQAAAGASSALSQQIESHSGGVDISGDDRQAASVEIVDKIFNSTWKLLDASAHNALQTLSASQSRGDVSENGDDDQDDLNADAKSPWLVMPVALPDLKAVELLENMKLSLQKALEAVFPTEASVVEKILNSSVVGWESLGHRVQTLEDQQTSLQIELQRVVNATWGQLNRSAMTTRAMLVLTELEVVATMKDLNQQWDVTTQKTREANTRSWRAVEQRIRPFTAEFSLHMAPFKTRAFCRELTIDEFSSDDAFAQRQYGLVQRRQDLRLEPEEDGDDDSDVQQKSQEFGAGLAGVRVRALLTVGFEIWRSVRRLLLAADWSFACLKILEVVIELWTDSYSTMASVDIREISSIQNTSDAWQILRCKHDFTSVIYFLVTQAELLVQTFIEYVVWLCVGVGGTGVLVLWKWEFLQVCGQEQQQEPPHVENATLVQSLLSVVLPIRGSSWDPMLEIETQSHFAANFTQSESWRLANASRRAWTNQSMTFERLQIHHQTLVSLTEMYDQCASEQKQSESLEVGVSTTDSCASLDQSSAFDSIPRAAAAMTTQEPNGTVFTQAFDHCFPGNSSLVSNKFQVHELHQSQACAAERALYLTVSSWWLLVVVWSANRFLARLVVKTCALFWWRFFSANRLEFIGFCYEDGSIQKPEALASAVQEHLRHLRWSIALRVLGMAAVVACCVLIWHLVLHRML